MRWPFRILGSILLLSVACDQPVAPPGPDADAGVDAGPEEDPLVCTEASEDQVFADGVLVLVADLRDIGDLTGATYRVGMSNQADVYASDVLTLDEGTNCIRFTFENAPLGTYDDAIIVVTTSLGTFGFNAASVEVESGETTEALTKLPCVTCSAYIDCDDPNNPVCSNLEFMCDGDRAPAEAVDTCTCAACADQCDTCDDDNADCRTCREAAEDLECLDEVNTCRE